MDNCTLLNKCDIIRDSNNNYEDGGDDDYSDDDCGNNYNDENNDLNFLTYVVRINWFNSFP